MAAAAAQHPDAATAFTARNGCARASTAVAAAAAGIPSQRRAQRRRALDSANDTTNSDSSSGRYRLPGRSTPDAAMHLCFGRGDDAIPDKVAASRTQQARRSASQKAAGCLRSSFPSPTTCPWTPFKSAQQPPSVVLSLTDEPASSSSKILSPQCASSHADSLPYAPWESVSSQLRCDSLDRECAFDDGPSPEAQSTSLATGHTTPQLNTSSGGSVTSRKDPETLAALMSDSTSRLVDEQLEVFELLGTGGSGSVYRAWWKGLPVAAKRMVLKEDAQGKASRQISEATMSVGLTHPNIVNTYTYDMKALADASRWRIHSARMTSWQLVILQELCSGGTLRRYIDEGAPTPNSDSSGSLPMRTRLIWALQLAHDIACGLEHLHSKNIVHLDLNPNNVLLQAAATPRLQGLTWVAKVADFGLSVAFEEGRSHASRVFVGTPHYIAPETQGHGTVSRHSDIFTFGVLLYELAVGSADVLRALAPSAPFKASPRPGRMPPQHAELPQHGDPSAADGTSAAAGQSSRHPTSAGEFAAISTHAFTGASHPGSHCGMNAQQATTTLVQDGMQALASAASVVATDCVATNPPSGIVTTGRSDTPPCSAVTINRSEVLDAQTADGDDDVLPPLLGGGRLRHDANVLPPLPSTWPAKYRALVRACLSQAPGLRPDVAEVRQVLASLLDVHADVNS